MYSSLRILYYFLYFATAQIKLTQIDIQAAPTANLVFSNADVTFYDIERTQKVRYPPISSLLTRVIALDKITFKIQNREFTVIPLESVHSVTQGKSKLLGNFKRISTSGGVIVLVYSMYRDSTKYECVVKISPEYSDSYKYEYSQFRTTLIIKLRSLMETIERRTIGVSMTSPVIAKRILSTESEKSEELAVMGDENGVLIFGNILLGTKDGFKTAKELISERLIIDNCGLNKLFENNERLKLSGINKQRTSQKEKDEESESEATKTAEEKNAL